MTPASLLGLWGAQNLRVLYALSCCNRKSSGARTATCRLLTFLALRWVPLSELEQVDTLMSAMVGRVLQAAGMGGFKLVPVPFIGAVNATFKLQGFDDGHLDKRGLK